MDYGRDNQHAGGLHRENARAGALQQNTSNPPIASLLSTAEKGPETPDSGASSQVPLEIQEALLPKVVTAQYQHPFGPWRRRYMVVLVSIITALLCADQNLLAPNLSAAAAYFNLNETQKDTYLGGYLMAAFFLVGAPAALVCGWLADKHNRVHLLVAIILIGEAPCLCTYWVNTLWQFFLVRMLTGVAVGGCFPLVFSLLGDLFPVSQRSAMAALVQIAVGAGIGGGQMLAGLVGPATNWKVPFVVMAAPTLVLAIVLFVTTKEPPRGAFEEALSGQLAAGGTYSEEISWRKVRRLLRIPSNWLIILQGLPGCLPWGVMQTYINDYLHLNKGFSIELSTVVILLFGIGCGVGVVAGGAAGQLLYNWRKESMAVLTGVSVLAGTAPVWAIINADISFGVCLVMSALAGFLVSIAGPNTRAIMLNVNTPETRGVALALQSVTDDLGRGLGPVIVAGFISQLGRVGAFNISVAGWIPCGILLCCLVFCMRRDESNMQRQLAQKSAAMLEQIRVQGLEGSSAEIGPGCDQGFAVSSSQEGLAAIAAAKEGTAGRATEVPASWPGHTSNLDGSSTHKQQHMVAGTSRDVSNLGHRPVWAGDSADSIGHVRKYSVVSDPGAGNVNHHPPVEQVNSRQQLLELHRMTSNSNSSTSYSSPADLAHTLPSTLQQQDLAPSTALSGAGARHRGSHLRTRSNSGGSSGGGRGHSGMGRGATALDASELE